MVECTLQRCTSCRLKKECGDTQPFICIDCELLATQRPAVPAPRGNALEDPDEKTAGFIGEHYF